MTGITTKGFDSPVIHTAFLNLATDVDN